MDNYKFITGKQSTINLAIPKNSPYLLFHPKTQHITYKDNANFVIGEKNPKGINLQPRIEGGQIVADYTFLPEHVGPPGMAHGGALAAVCDDVMGLACFCTDNVAMTINLNVNYIQPVTLGDRHFIKAWVVDISDKIITCESIISNTNAICVEATGLFYLIDPNATA